MIQEHTVNHWKALTYFMYLGQKGLSCCCTLSICQDVMKSGNLVLKQGLVVSHMVTIVTTVNPQLEVDFVSFYS